MLLDYSVNLRQMFGNCIYYTYNRRTLAMTVSCKITSLLLLLLLLLSVVVVVVVVVAAAAATAIT